MIPYSFLKSSEIEQDPKGPKKKSRERAMKPSDMVSISNSRYKHHEKRPTRSTEI